MTPSTSIISTLIVIGSASLGDESLLLGGAIDHFALLAQHYDAGFPRFVHANTDARMSLWVGNQQLGLLVLIGERDALHP